jgi:hypothetical protein
MISKRWRFAATLMACAVLAGCAEVSATQQATGRQGISFTPDQAGLAVTGNALRIDFGRAPAGVIAALDRELGPGRDLGVAGCGADISAQRDWGGLVLTFTSERFVGWRQAGESAGQICEMLA